MERILKILKKNCISEKNQISRIAKHKLLARILKAKTWETQIKSVEYPNEIYLSWIFFPHPAHSWGPPDVFWGSALTDIVMMLKRREERAACITSFLFSRENNVPNGLRICFSTTFCNHSSKGQKLLVYHVFTRFWLQFPLKTTQIDLSHSIHILSYQIDTKSLELRKQTKMKLL